MTALEYGGSRRRPDNPETSDERRSARLRWAGGRSRMKTRRPGVGGRAPDFDQPRRAQRRVVFGNDESLGDLIAFGFFGVLERDNVEPGNVELGESSFGRCRQQQPDAQGGDPAGPRPHDRCHGETREQALCQCKMRYVTEGCDTGDSSRLPFRGRRVTGNGSLLGRWYRRRLLSRGAHAGDEGRVVAHEEAGRVLVLVTHDVERTLAIAVRAFVQRIVASDSLSATSWRLRPLP